MSESEKLTAIVLAGGMGTRLATRVPDRPKVLAEVNGEPFIVKLLRQLVLAKIKQVVVCTGHRANEVEAAISDHFGNNNICFSREALPMGTGGALALAGEYVLGQYALVLNGDSFIQVDYQDLLMWHCAHGARVSLVVTSVENSGRFGNVTLGKTGRICEFSEKVEQSDNGGNLINAGVYLINKSILQTLSRTPNSSFEQEVLPKLIPDRVYGYISDRPFIDIGTPDSFDQADSFFNAKYPAMGK